MKGRRGMKERREQKREERKHLTLFEKQMVHEMAEMSKNTAKQNEKEEEKTVRIKENQKTVRKRWKNKEEERKSKREEKRRKKKEEKEGAAGFL